MPTVLPWILPGTNSQTILGDAHLPDSDPIGVLVISHGFKGYKDYGFFPHLAEAAATAGLIAHRFNFSHSGMTNRIETFERPDLFEQDRWSYQIHDLLAVATAIHDGQLPGAEVPVVWYGHSRGGITSLLTGAKVFSDDSLAELRPAGIISAAAPSVALNLDDQQRDMLRRSGRLPSPSSRTNQDLYVGIDWLREIERSPQQFDPVSAAAQVRCPLLVIHGDVDATVPVSSAHALADAAGDHARLEVLKTAGHTFNARNPLPIDQPIPPVTQRMIDMSCKFAVGCCRR